MRALALDGALPTGRVVLEASAGTGKTFSLTALVVRHVVEAGARPDAVLVVTFTRAAANELRDRTRTTLDAAARTLRTGCPPADAPWMHVLLGGTDADRQLRLRRADEAVAHFDDLTITTIHGFCQQSLAQLGVRAGSNPDAVLVASINDLVREVCRDSIVAALADDPTALNSNSGKARIGNPKQAETELRSSVVALANNPAAHRVPDREYVTDQLALRWAELAVGAREEVVRRQAARSEIGYDTLISGMHRALHDPRHGDTIAQQLAERYGVVLVDEFQDTDQLQWEVFDRAFSTSTLITVGDPKQAIYRFRGADVHAYLGAVSTATANEPLGLSTNYRSDPALLDGLATLFDGATLGDRRIPFVPVTAPADAPLSRFGAAGAPHTGPAVAIRAVPLTEELQLASSRTGELAMPAVRSLVLADLVGRVVELLDHGQLSSGDVPSIDGAIWRAVEPGDIAVLVPSHLEANNVAEALRRAHVPAVRTRTGSVLKTAAAAQWRLLLATLAQPHQTPVVRAGALGWFLDTDINRLTAEEDALADLQVRAADLGDRLRLVGVSAFYDEQKAPRDPGDPRGPGLVATVLGHEWGERHLTDLDHISELLAAATQQRATDPAQVLRILDEMIAEADDLDDAAMRRIDSDARAVQITTVHSAKGLEFPIVLVPFAFKKRANISTPMTYTAPDGRRTIDLASRVPWVGGPEPTADLTTRPEQDMRRYRTIQDIEGDELRLLYVALTRAKHRLEVWWASAQGANASALGRLLLDRYGAGPVQNSTSTWGLKKRGSGLAETKAPFVEMAPPAALGQIEALVEGSDGHLALTMVGAGTVPVVWGGRPQAAPPALRLASRGGRATVADESWKRWSFTRLGAMIEAANLDAAAVTEPPGERGGYDEPVDDSDELGGTQLTVAPPSAQLQLSVGPPAHLAPVAGGARFGTFVHGVLEHVDFTSPTLDADLQAMVAESAVREGLQLGDELPLESTAAGIAAAIRTPLGPLTGGRALADFAPADRLDELAFDLPLCGGVGGRAARAGMIGEILLKHLPRHHELRPFARSLAGEFRAFDIGGWMNGSIDAVLRVGDGAASRFVVIDYKTNRLHATTDDDPVAAYRPDRLVGAMEHSRYPLQALIYTVALHRYLRWRLGERYDPAVHLGGIGYLFLRGMVGPATPAVNGTPHGVFSWTPPTAAIVAIDRLFATGGAA